MSPERDIHLTPRMEQAVHELQRLITARFPQAAFVVEEGVDPEGIYLVTTVDIDDPDEVIAVVGDRLVALQVEEGFPLYVTPLQPIERVIAELRERETAMPPSPLPLPRAHARATRVLMEATPGASMYTGSPCEIIS